MTCLKHPGSRPQKWTCQSVQEISWEVKYIQESRRRHHFCDFGSPIRSPKTSQKPHTSEPTCLPLLMLLSQWILFRPEVFYQGCRAESGGKPQQLGLSFLGSWRCFCHVGFCGHVWFLWEGSEFLDIRLLDEFAQTAPASITLWGHYVFFFSLHSDSSVCTQYVILDMEYHLFHKERIRQWFDPYKQTRGCVCLHICGTARNHNIDNVVTIYSYI